jgi:hypothetical protein
MRWVLVQETHDTRRAIHLDQLVIRQSGGDTLDAGHTWFAEFTVAFVVGYSDFDYLRSVSRKPARITWA